MDKKKNFEKKVVNLAKNLVKYRNFGEKIELSVKFKFSSKTEKEHRKF